jgi:hypothetical protein
LKTLFVLGRKKPPIIIVLSEFKRSNLKVTCKFAKTPRGLLVFIINHKNTINIYENEEVAFIGQRSGVPLKWRQFDEISKDTISKIKYTALFQNLMKPSLKSSSAIYMHDYVKVQ